MALNSSFNIMLHCWCSIIYYYLGNTPKYLAKLLSWCAKFLILLNSVFCQIKLQQLRTALILIYSVFDGLSLYVIPAAQFILMIKFGLIKHDCYVCTGHLAFITLDTISW